jgi:NAD(P)-dependent dehydrogenase (short-subunit alcohol dehydrogenase family)
MGSLDGRVALITGAARGQGKAHALALAAEGADIVACDVPRPMATLTYPLATHEDLVLAAKQVEAVGRRCLAVPLDVRDGADVDAAVARTLDEFGRLDIVIANAGVVTTGPLVEVSDACWEEMVATNLTGVFNTLRAALPVMRERRYGRIVVTSSMGGRMGIPDQAAYNATKWGVIGLAKSVALEVAKEGITVNVVCPATVLTPMVQPDPDVPVPEEVAARFLRTNPIKRLWLEAADITGGSSTWSLTPGW